jgi:hypothetical protein
MTNMAKQIQNVFATHIQLASNLRTHRLNVPDVYSLIRPSAPVLALLGDIGTPSSDSTKAFIEWVSKNYDKVLWVPGATEYSSYSALHWSDASHTYYKTLRNWDAKNVNFCQKQTFVDDTLKLRFIATTGHFPPVPPAPLAYAGRINRIFTDGDYREFSINELHWIKEQLNKLPCTESYPIVLLTYGPLFSPTARYLAGQTQSILEGTYRVKANLYGTSEDGTPATNSLHYKKSAHLNMAGHPGFKPSYAVQVELQ